MFWKNLTQRIDDLISVLARPLSAEEAQDGWTNESKQAIRTYFENMRAAMKANAPLPPFDVARGIDAWGVQGGKLLSEAAKITNKLRSR